MFPDPLALAGDAREQILQWYIVEVEDALKIQTDNFRQLLTSPGKPVGLCGWILHAVQSAEATLNLQPRHRLLCPSTVSERTSLRGTTCMVFVVCIPLTSFRSISSDHTKQGLTFMMVHTDHQRRGLDSGLLRCLCEEFDRAGRFAFVMADQAGVRLYMKFESRTVCVVLTKEPPDHSHAAIAPSLESAHPLTTCPIAPALLPYTLTSGLAI